MKENASRGFCNGGFTPFGYRRIKQTEGMSEKTRLMPDEKETSIVKKNIPNGIRW